MTLRLMRGMVAARFDSSPAPYINDPKGRIHKMEKYAKLLKGLEKCAGPDCCKDECPYYKKTIGGMTCRARLLLDANIAITNELARNENAETLLEHIKSLDADIDDMEAENNTLRDERDGLRIQLERETEARRSVEAHRDAIDGDREEIACERDKLRAAVIELAKERDALNAERDALRCKLAAQCQGETDRPSVSSDDLDNLACEVQRYRSEAGYWHGKAAALEWFIREWFREGGFQP